MAARKKKTKPVETVESKMNTRTVVILILVIMLLIFVIGGYIQIETNINELKTIMQHMDSHHH